FRVLVSQFSGDRLLPEGVIVLDGDRQLIFEDIDARLKSEDRRLQFLNLLPEVAHLLTGVLKGLDDVSERGYGVVERLIETEPEIESIAEHARKVTHVIRK